MAWNRTSETDPAPAAPRPQGSSSASRPSILGPSISIKGTLKGSEDLRIEGRVEGTVRFDKQNVVVSESGRIKADIFGSKICIEGEVEGNLFGEREIIIRPSGKLEGNITAPSVTLENGAKFRGSIDMEPATPEKTKSSGDAKKAEASRSTAQQAPAAAAPSSA